jgi:hypothetical protein
VDLDVAPVNDTPSAGNDGFTIDEDTLSIISSANLLANDSDADGDSLSVSVASQPTNGNLSDNGDGTFTYTPHANFSGTDSFTYAVDDGNGGLESAQVTIVVQPVADAPSVSDQAFTLAADAPDSTVVGTVNASDPDAGDTLTYAISGGNSGGAFAIDPNTGEITVADAAALDAAGSPQIALTVAVTDSGGTTVLATVTVDLTDTITPVGPELRDAIDDVDTILEPPLPAPEAPTPEAPEETEGGQGGGVAPVESDDSASKRQGGHGPSGNPQAGGAGPGQSSSAIPQITNAPPAPKTPIAGAPDAALAALEVVLAKAGGPGWSDWSLAGAGATAPQPTQQTPMFDALDQVLQDMDDSADTLSDPTERLMIQVTMGSSISLSAGFLAWALRGGSLMASLMSTMPLWRGLDPMPVLAAHRRSEDDSDEERAGPRRLDSIDRLFDQSPAQAAAT